MNKLLIKLFVKNSEDVKSHTVHLSYGRLASIVGIISNVILTLAKIILGLFSGSMAIIADGINNMTDASSSIITLVGFKMANAPEDKSHPYGHARIEYLTGLIVSILIIVVGITLLKSGFEKIFNPTTQTFGIITFIILGLSIVVKLWQSSFNFCIGKIINSTALKATAIDSRNDVISTCVVIVSLLIEHFFDVNIDGYLVILLSLFIIKSGIDLVRETSSPLLGEAPSKDLVNSIRDTVIDNEGVLGIHDLVVHNYGPGKIFASMHVEVDSRVDVMISHDLIDNIECEIKNKLGIHFVIHMDPIVVNDPVVNKVQKAVCDFISNYPDIREVHDIRAVVGPTHTNVIFDVVLSPEHTYNLDDLRELLTAEVKKLDTHYIAVVTFDMAYF